MRIPKNICRRKYRRHSLKFSFLALNLLPLLVLVLSLLLLEVNGFVVSVRQSSRQSPSSSVVGSNLLSMATAPEQQQALSTKEAQEASTATAAAIPNWRTLSVSQVEQDGSSLYDNADDAVTTAFSIVQQRPLYSQACFDDALQLHEQLTLGCTDSYVAGPVQAALNWLDHAYRLYGPESVICSFNGGKDAVAILHLLRAAHANYYKNLNQTAPSKMVRPRVIYFEHSDEFPEILDFLHETVDTYDLDMIAFEKGIPFQKGLQVLVNNNWLLQRCSSSSSSSSDESSTTKVPPPAVVPPHPLAFVLGTRQGDPNAFKQGHFAPSSHYMPPFMRVNPILEWTYGHVWHFLRLFQLPYCVLYDQGYTSLGTTKDTMPCPVLAVPGTTTGNDDDGCSIPKFWPAFMLRDWDKERAGRLGKEQPKKKSSRSKSVTISATATTAAVAVTTVTTQDQDDNKKSASVGLPDNCNDDVVTGRLSALSELRALVAVDEDNKTATSENDNTNSEAEDSTSCVSYSTDTVTQRTVGILIVGDEILKGFTADTNTQTAATALREQNVLLKRVVVVSDVSEDIVNEIRRLQKEVDVIITSGGVGPTHDDITIKSIAAALDCELTLHEEMAQMLRDKMNNKKDKMSDGSASASDDNNDVPLTELQIKMATLPKTAKLRYLSDNPDDWPVLQCQNLFILPGVPQFFTAKIGLVAKYLSCQLERSLAYKVVLSVDENSIVKVLNQVVENHPDVSFGSYPFVSHPDFKTVLTVEGRLLRTEDNTVTTSSSDNNNTAAGTTTNTLLDARRNSKVWNKDMIDNSHSKESMDKHVQLALDELITALPKGSVLRVDNDDMLFT